MNNNQFQGIMRKYYFVFFTICYSLSGYCQPILSKAQALEDFNWLTFSLEYVHPRLYKYESKYTVQSRFDSLKNVLSAKDSISTLDFLSHISKLNAQVNCGHLYTIPQGELQDVVLSKKVMPFQIKILNGKLFALYDVGKGERIPDGSEIKSINGKPSSQIIQLMKQGIATDGWIDARKDRLIERYFFESFHGFDLYYYLHVDRDSVFNIRYKALDSQIEVTTTRVGISHEERSNFWKKIHQIDVRSWFKKPSPTFTVDEKNNLAVLTISRSFYDQSIDPNYDSVLSVLFQGLEDQNVGNLIIDLRDNEGGSEHHEIELMKYLYDKPFKLYQNIYQSHLDFRPLKPIIIERDTSQLLFNNDDEYMRRFSNNLWINNYEYSENLQLQPPKRNVFKGQLYVLMNGITFSSAANLVADIKKTTNAIFIGEEDGGAFEGPTGGTSIVIQLPNSKIMVRISPNIHIGYMYKKHPIGRGVLPNYPISYTIRDVVDGVDLEMAKAMELISKRSGNQVNQN